MSSSVILFQFDLLSNGEAGLQYPEEPHLGVFTAQSRPARAVNEEDEEYVTWAATQDHQTGAVSIRAQKHSNGNITSARLESQGVSYSSTRLHLKYLALDLVHCIVRRHQVARICGGDHHHPCQDPSPGHHDGSLASHLDAGQN